MDIYNEMKIITYQVITGNYNFRSMYIYNTGNYNIPSNNRELQHLKKINFFQTDYNIPSNNRELQH